MTKIAVFIQQASTRTRVLLALKDLGFEVFDSFKAAEEKSFLMAIVEVGNTQTQNEFQERYGSDPSFPILSIGHALAPSTIRNDGLLEGCFSQKTMFRTMVFTVEHYLESRRPKLLFIGETQIVPNYAIICKNIEDILRKHSSASGLVIFDTAANPFPSKQVTEIQSHLRTVVHPYFRILLTTFDVERYRTGKLLSSAISILNNTQSESIHDFRSVIHVYWRTQMTLQHFLYQYKKNIENGEKRFLTELRKLYLSSPLSFHSGELYLKHSKDMPEKQQYKEVLSVFKKWNPNSKLLLHIRNTDEAKSIAA